MCRVPINLAEGKPPPPGVPGNRKQQLRPHPSRKSARTLCAVDNVLTLEVLLDALLRRFSAQHCGGPLVLAVGHVFGRSSSQCGRITLTPSNLGSRGDYLSFGISIIEIGRVVFEIYGRTDTHTYTRDLSWDSPHVNT